MTSKFVIPSLLALCLTAGCTTKFIADFEADSAGSAPDTMPAGAPDDQLFVLPNGGSITVSSSGALTGSKSLRMTGPAPAGGTGPNTFMYAETLNDPNQRVYASWTGLLTSNAGARVFFFTGHFSAMVEIEMRNGTIRVNDEVVGEYTPGQQHNIFVNANPADDTYGVTFIEPGNTVTDTGTVLNASFFPKSNIGLTMQLISASSSGSYRVDTVRMSERNPSASPSG